MPMIETWLRSDLANLVRVVSLEGSAFHSDIGGNKIGVILTKEGVPITVDEDVRGYFIRPDGETITFNGSRSGNRAWVVLPASAYTAKGPFTLTIKCGATTIGACTGYIR